MSLDVALHALSRFGMGVAPGEAHAIADDPRGWVLAQIKPAPPLPVRLQGLKPGDELEAEVLRRKADKAKNPDEGKRLKDIYFAEAAARTVVAAESKTPFVERWVQFWSNHFTVSVARPRVAALVGAFEREAIRPQAFNRFRDMLGASTRHPAMLHYLDNAVSVGPNSTSGQKTKRGLNENLARELLELHTLGVDGGYGQADVEALAAILTGWTVGTDRDGPAGAFRFVAKLHEPGPKTLLGKTYKEAGVVEGAMALDALAEHPATAKFVATKLARHFIADDPPPAAVDRLARHFLASGGSLLEMAKAVAESPEAWAAPLAKLRSPYDFAVALLRAAGSFSLPDQKLVNQLALLGQAPFAAPSPAGWPDRAEAWMGPEAMMRRLEWSRAVAQRLARNLPGPQALDAFLGAAASPATRQAVLGARDDAAEALFLLFASREFQRR